MRANVLLVQALEFFRAPARFPDLRDPGQPLQGDTGPLLRLAAGTEPASSTLGGLADSAEWRAAAQFFIEQVLLAPGADYYRLHGLARGADEASIKEHHRLLMRLVHPDRETVDEAWQAAASARINQAYATLRDPEKRAEYARMLKFAAENARSARSASAAAHPPVLRRVAPPVSVRRHGDTPFQRFIWRHLPQVSLACVVAAAAAWVGWVYLNNAPSAAIGGGAESGTIVALDTSARLPATNAAPQDTPAPSAVNAPRAPSATDVLRGSSAQRGMPAPAPLPAAPILVATAAPAQTPLSPTIAAATPRAAVPEPAPGTVAPPTTVSPAVAAANSPGAVPVPATAPSIANTRPAEDSSEPVATRAPALVTAHPLPQANAAASADVVPLAAVPQPVAANAAPANAAPVKPRAPEPGAVIPQLALRYERGNLDQFMELFDVSARNETGGWAKIRKDYDDLFGSTVARQLIVWDLHWTQRDDVWHGEGRFQVRVQRRNENFLRLYGGTLRLDVVGVGQSPLIRGIYHQLTSQPAE